MINLFWLRSILGFYIFPLFYERLFFLWIIYISASINPFSFYFSFFSLHLCIFFQCFFALKIYYFYFFIIILLYFLHIVLLYSYIYSSRNIRRTKCILLLYYCKTSKLCYRGRYIHDYKVLIWFDLLRMPFLSYVTCVIHIYRLLKGYRTYFKFWSCGGLFFNCTQERIYCNILFTEKYEIWEVHVFENIYSELAAKTMKIMSHWI